MNLEHLGRAWAKQNLSDDGNDFLPLLPWPRYKRWLRITVVGVSRLETEKGQDIHQRAGIPDLAKLWRGAEPKEILKECTKIGCGPGRSKMVPAFGPTRAQRPAVLLPRWQVRVSAPVWTL